MCSLRGYVLPPLFILSLSNGGATFLMPSQSFHLHIKKWGWTSDSQELRGILMPSWKRTFILRMLNVMPIFFCASWNTSMMTVLVLLLFLVN